MTTHHLFVGNVATAPDLRTTGTPAVKFRIGTTERYQKGGEWHDHEPVFWTVEAWRGLAEAIAAEFSVGDPIVLGAEIRSTSWTTPEGDKRTRTYLLARAAGRNLAVPPKNAKTKPAAEPANTSVEATSAEEAWEAE